MQDIFDEVKAIVQSVLGIEDRYGLLTENTKLIGHIAELDSMAVVSVLTEIEEYFGIVIEDDDVSGDTFETLGTLAAFVREQTLRK